MCYPRLSYFNSGGHNSYARRPEKTGRIVKRDKNCIYWIGKIKFFYLVVTLIYLTAAQVIKAGRPEKICGSVRQSNDCKEQVRSTFPACVLPSFSALWFRWGSHASRKARKDTRVSEAR